MTTLILCAGRQTRFDDSLPHANPQPKQLLPFHDSPLLARTIAQLQHLNRDPIVITHDPTITAISKHHGARPWKQGPDTRIIETLLATKPIWSNPTTILLGDVYYDSCLPFILSLRSKIAFFGNEDEIFALTFKPHRTLDHAIAKALTSKAAKLWQLYRAYEGIPLDTHVILTNRIFHLVTDRTDDVDTWQEYQTLRRKVNG